MAKEWMMFEETILNYLKELNPTAYNRMVKEGTLEQIVESMNERMEDDFDMIWDKIEKADPPKETDYMRQVGKIENQKHKAIEMVREEIEQEVRAL